MRISSHSFILILLKLHRCFVHGLKICMWFQYNPLIIFYHFSCNLNLAIFQALLLSTYVDSMYLVRVTPLMNFTFSDDSLYLKKNLGGGHKFSEFVCLFRLRLYNNFSVMSGTEPQLPGYYQYFLGGTCMLLKDTTPRPE